MKERSKQPALGRREWVPANCDALVQSVARDVAASSSAQTDALVEALTERNREIHEHECINLNPATNIMNPRAEALLARGLGSRPSLGYPGDKYEMGLEAIEKIEAVAAALAAEVFGARFAEIRVASGAMANLYAFMATAKPGDAIVVPPGSIGGHVTHHDAGAAGLYGVNVHPAPVDAGSYTVDLDGLRALCLSVRPSLVTLGGSLNLFPHPVREVRAIADEVGAKLLFDAAHLCGLFAGRAWPNPLHEGAHVMTMSTYKSLGGPAGGLLLTNDAEIAERVDAIAFPGLTANFDAAKSAALAVTLLDWREQGDAYAAQMVATAAALGRALVSLDLPVFARGRGCTASHQLALEAARYAGGQAAAKRLREANLLTCGIGLPVAPVEGDLNGLRIGTPEIVRTGMTPADMPALAALVERGLSADKPAAVARDVTAMRRRFTKLRYLREA